MLDWNNVSNWHILLVEDEPDNLEVVSETLMFYGASVRTAQDGQQGLEQLENYTPDVILLDLSMPRMDGWKMVQILKEDPKTKAIPVVALTAHAMAGDRERTLGAGFDGYISKPISITTFLADLRKTLEDNQPTDSLPSEEPQTGADSSGVKL
ncbi:MAG: response regulator [Chloroflexi bacterium]|nr:response regulator [Chloroflexota bacterium]